MFYDTSYLPFVEILEDNWSQTLTEFNNLENLKALPYPETDLYLGEWNVLPFMFFGEVFEETCEKFPKTWSLLKNIPGLRTASFSILGPHTEITPHTGFTDKVLRCHLALKVPEKCAIIVGDDTKYWEVGKCLVFDDTTEHYAYNNSDTDRVILILDVDKENYERSL